MKPFFSMVIPFHNSERTLEKCLKCIFNSNFKSFEVIAVSDNSNQESIDIAKKFKTKIIYSRKNKGTAYSRNIGAKNAKSKFIVFIDSDVIINKNHLTRLKKYILKFKNEVAFQGIYDHNVNYKNSVTQYLQSYLCYYVFSEKIKFIQNLNGSFFSIRKDIFKKLGGFDENFKSSNAEDADFGYKIINFGKKIRILKDIKVKHLPEWSIKDFIIKILRIHTGEMKMFCRNKNISKKIKQTNYLPIILSIALLALQMIIIPFCFFFPIKWFIFFSTILNFIIFIINFDFFSYVIKQKSLLIFLKILPSFYLHIFLFFLSFFKGIIEYYVFNKKY